MEIKKFNESTNWSDDRIQNLFKLREKIHEEEGEIISCLYEFINFNREILPKQLLKSLKYYTTSKGNVNFEIKDFFSDYKSRFCVDISWDDGDESEDILFTKEQYDEFVGFMNNPDLYKDANKYNI